MTSSSPATDPTETVPTERELLRTGYSPEERGRVLARMREIKDSFYAAAQRAGHHQFLEFAGLMAEYIKACERMHGRGIDFATTELNLEAHEAAYIAEKLDCIFGEALTEPAAREAFLGVLGDKGGWAHELTGDHEHQHQWGSHNGNGPWTCDLCGATTELKPVTSSGMGKKEEVIW